MSKMKELRFFKGLSQWQIRMVTGISQAKLSLIERGYIVPQEEEKKKIAAALNVRPEEVFPE